MTELPTVPKGMEEMETGVNVDEVGDYVSHSQELVDIVKKRAEKRQHGHMDAIVVVADWATREEYDIVDSRVLLATNVHDHSAKAIRLDGAYEVDVDQLPDYKYMSNVINKVDGEYDNDYLPKSAVEKIIQLAPEVMTE